MRARIASSSLRMSMSTVRGGWTVCGLGEIRQGQLALHQAFGSAAFRRRLVGEDAWLHLMNA
ncbi:MAG: hypothetical protein U0694_03960 [Anaerolineae bacterium]